MKVLALDNNNNIIEVEVSDGGGGMLYRKQAVFTSSGTFTLPATALPSVDYVVMGAGASGSAYTSDTAVTGGGGGQYVEGIAELVPGNTYSIVVGAGGTAVSGTTSGVNGGASEIVGVAIANGGYGDGRAGHGQPIAASQDSINPNGGATGFGLSNNPLSAQTGPGGTCSAGASVHYNNNNTYRIAGIPGINGGTCAINDSNFPPSAGSGSAPGCGGGARTYSSNSSRKSGAGFRGEVVVTYWDSVP